MKDKRYVGKYLKLMIILFHVVIFLRCQNWSSRNGSVIFVLVVTAICSKKCVFCTKITFIKVFFFLHKTSQSLWEPNMAKHYLNIFNKGQRYFFNNSNRSNRLLVVYHQSTLLFRVLRKTSIYVESLNLNLICIFKFLFSTLVHLHHINRIKKKRVMRSFNWKHLCCPLAKSQSRFDGRFGIRRCYSKPKNHKCAYPNNLINNPTKIAYIMLPPIRSTTIVADRRWSVLWFIRRW